MTILNFQGMGVMGLFARWHLYEDDRLAYVTCFGEHHVIHSGAVESTGRYIPIPYQPCQC
jgi:hypothetical protein